MKTLMIPAILILGMTLAISPAQAKVITLKDGSTINGEITSVGNGYYMVNTQGMGQIKVEDKNIVSIAAQAPAAGTTQMMGASGQQNPSSLASTPEYKSIQNKIVSSPDLMNDIQSLTEDPEIMSFLSDPAFLAAIQSGNMDTLKNNPRLVRLSQHPKIQALMNKIQSR